MTKCPKYGRPCTQIEDKLFRCDSCKMLTDGIDDGDVGYGRQDRHAERKEEYQIRQKNRERERMERQRKFRR